MLRKIINLLATYNNPKDWIKNIQWRLPSTISQTDTIFIIGAPRSGTTLLQRILSVHSELFSIEGETGLFSYQNIFDKKRHHFNFKSDQLTTLFKNSNDIIDFFTNAVNELKKNHHSSNRFVEKTPQHILHLPFLIKHFPNAKFIHIVRDGRDCYCSAQENSWVPQSRSIEEFARYWKKCVYKAISVNATENVLTIKYEDLVSKPNDVIPKVMNFLDLETEPCQTDHTKIANDQRARKKEFAKLQQPINTSSINRWASTLNKKEVDVFSKIAGDQLRHYGYK